MLRFRKAVAGAFALPLLASVAWSGTASANGRFPAANQLVASRTDPDFFVLRTTFGILFSHDHGTTWDWICEKAVGYGGSEDPAMGLTSTGVIAGIFSGLAVSPDKGCSWGFAVKQPVTDVVVRYDDSHGAYALTSAYAGADDGGSTLFKSNVYATKDDGTTWAVVGDAIDANTVVETIEVSKTDPHRLFLSGTRTDSAGVVTFDFLASKDDGAHYTRTTIDGDPKTERAPFISAVDPINANRVYVRIKGTNGSRLVVTDDGGATFRSVLTAQGDLLGFALSADGSKVYTGGPLDGVMVASSTDLTFRQTSKIQVQCLTTIGTTLYACSNEASGFVLGTSDDDGVTFAPKLHLGCMRGPLACPSTSSVAQCLVDYPALVDQLAVGVSCDTGGDAGPDGLASADGGTLPPPVSAPPGGCNACEASPSGGARGASMLGAAMAAIGALAARKKRRRS